MTARTQRTTLSAGIAMPTSFSSISPSTLDTPMLTMGPQSALALLPAKMSTLFLNYS